MRHVILISGKDSLAAALVQREREPNLPYEYVFNETGWDLPETLEWIDRVQVFLGSPILRLGDDLTEICREEKCLPLAFRRFCTKLAKIKPLNDYLGKSPAVVYYGLRADEPERVGFVAAKGQPLTPAYPLREAGWGIGEVWQACQDAGLLPPAFRWAWMEARVGFLLGRDAWILDGLPPWKRNAVLAWRSRNNCDRCFYQRLYEKIGLWEHHPDRYEDACCLEEDLAHDSSFSWKQGYRLRDLPARSAEIKEKRARAIVKHLLGGLQQSLFDDDGDGPFVDELAATSCGLLCGK